MSSQNRSLKTLSVPEIAEITGFPVRRVYRHIQEGILEATADSKGFHKRVALRNAIRYARAYGAGVPDNLYNRETPKSKPKQAHSDRDFLPILQKCIDECVVLKGIGIKIRSVVLRIGNPLVEYFNESTPAGREFKLSLINKFLLKEFQDLLTQADFVKEYYMAITNDLMDRLANTE